MRRNRPDALCPQVKSLNYLNNILAKMEAVRQGVAEALMLNDLGNVAECTGDNIFIVKDGAVFTPPSRTAAWTASRARVVLEICRELQILAEEKTMNRFTITCADECFLTGTAAECVPVTKLDAYQLGSGKIGPVTRPHPGPLPGTDPDHGNSLLKPGISFLIAKTAPPVRRGRFFAPLHQNPKAAQRHSMKCSA